jgi:hypothetical protein
MCSVAKPIENVLIDLFPFKPRAADGLLSKLFGHLAIKALQQMPEERALPIFFNDHDSLNCHGFLFRFAIQTLVELAVANTISSVLTFLVPSKVYHDSTEPKVLNRFLVFDSSAFMNFFDLKDRSTVHY